MSVIRAAGFDMRASIAPAILGLVDAEERIERDEAGRVRRRYSVSAEGALDGELVQYDDHGHVEVQLPYRAGVLDGEARFFERGRLQLRMTYRNGVEEGERVLYGEQSKPAMTVQVRAGVQEGTTRWFRADGSLMRTAEFVEGEMKGEPVDYDERGRVVKKRK
jgi:antitoxin component YwqK of YwqJK toxin-antitoxin module